MNQCRSVPSCLPEQISWEQQTQCVGFYSSTFLLHSYERFDISCLTSSLTANKVFPSPSLQVWMIPVSRARCYFNGLFTQTFTVFHRLFLGFYGWGWFFLCSWLKWWKWVIAYLGGVCLADEADHRETELCCFNRKRSLSEEELGIRDDLQQSKVILLRRNP